MSDDKKTRLELGDEDSAIVIRRKGVLELVTPDPESEVSSLDELQESEPTFYLALALLTATGNEELMEDIREYLEFVMSNAKMDEDTPPELPGLSWVKKDIDWNDELKNLRKDDE